jgi:hypothetical protein
MFGEIEDGLRYVVDGIEVPPDDYFVRTHQWFDPRYNVPLPPYVHEQGQYGRKPKPLQLPKRNGWKVAGGSGDCFVTVSDSATGQTHEVPCTPAERTVLARPLRTGRRVTTTTTPAKPTPGATTGQTNYLPWIIVGIVGVIAFSGGKK